MTTMDEPVLSKSGYNVIRYYEIEKDYLDWRCLEACPPNYACQLVRDDRRGLVIRNSLINHVFAWGLMIPGIFCLVYGVGNNLIEQDWFGALSFALLGSFLTGIGYFLFRTHCYAPLTFDFESRRYFRGHQFDPAISDRHLQGSFEEILAFQLLEKDCSQSDEDSINYYTGFELNIVFKDKLRTNIMNSGNLDHVYRAGQKLAQFLDVPLYIPSALIE